MQTIIQVINKQTEKARVNHAALIGRISKGMENDNEGLAPVVDRIGKWHSPCDGYYDSVSDKFYAAGEFLPMPEVESDCFSGACYPKTVFKDRVILSGKALDSVKSLSNVDGVTLSTGKEFVKDGIKSAYLYINSHSKGHLKAIIDWAKNAVEEEKPEQPVIGKGEIEPGKQTVKATVIAIKLVESDFGVSMKLFAELENKATVYGTLPAALANCDRGDKIEFTATFEQANDDKTHAFYKRPSKAKVINE